MRISNPLRPLPHKPHLFSRFNNTSNSHSLKSLLTNRNSSPSQGSPLSKAILAQKRSPSWDIPTNLSLTKRFVGLCAFLFHLPPRIPLHGDSPPAFRQGPRSHEALEGAIRVAAPFSYNNEASVLLTDSHFLKLPDCDPYLGSLHRNVNPAPLDAATCAWLRSGALRLSQRDEGDKSSVPLGLLAFFGSDISHKHVTELIRSHSTTDQDTVNRMRAEHRVGRAAFKMPRKPLFFCSELLR